MSSQRWARALQCITRVRLFTLACNLVGPPWLGTMPRREVLINFQTTYQLHRRTADQVTWADLDGEQVATAYSWRDGGPDGGLHGEFMEGQGAASGARWRTSAFGQKRTLSC